MDKYTDLLSKITENSKVFSHYTPLSEYKAYYDDVPDFKHMNQCAINLVDKKKRKNLLKMQLKLLTYFETSSERPNTGRERIMSDSLIS